MVIPDCSRSVWVCAAILIAGCGAEPQSPEEQIRKLVERAEAAAQEKELGELSDSISDNYRDGRGQDKSQLVQRLRLYLLRHQSIHLYVHIEKIELPVVDLAEVTLIAGMAGRGIPEGSDWRLKADLYEIDLTLEGNDQDWQVISADWKRAGR